MPGSSSPRQRRFAFTSRMRLHRPSQFRTVLAGGMRKAVGPLNVYALPNDLGQPRLGLAVSRKVGRAIVRNRIKRRMREAFRLMQHDLPRGYDLVISARPHKVLTLAEYQHLLSKAVRALHHSWAENTNQPDDPSAPSPRD